MFIFGSITGLRFSDLIKLSKNNLEKRDGNFYLVTKSKKTKQKSFVKLPHFLIELIKRYKKSKTLLPPISLYRFNANIKKICLLAGWDYPVEKWRDKEGISKKIRNGNSETFRFCDLVSSHIMRRTAITTMLTLGVPELIVRKVSGHSDGSKEFFRYVELAQQYIDKEINKAHEKLFLV